jgi:hypothetical protein
VPEGATATEREIAKTGGTRKVEEVDDADSEAYQTKDSPPFVTSHGEREVEKKRKRPEDVDGSDLCLV